MTHAAPSNNPQELSYEEVATKCPKVRLSSDVHALNEADIGRLELICNAILFEHPQCLPRTGRKKLNTCTLLQFLQTSFRIMQTHLPT